MRIKIKYRWLIVTIAAIICSFLCIIFSSLSCAGYLHYLFKEKTYILEEQNLDELQWLTDKLSESVNDVEAIYIFDGGMKASLGANFKSLIMVKSRSMLNTEDTEQLFVKILCEFDNQNFLDILFTHGWFSCKDCDYGVAFYSIPGKSDAVFLTQYSLSSFSVWIDHYDNRNFDNSIWQLSDYIDESEFFAKLPVDNEVSVDKT